MKLHMTALERQAFLADLHVGVISIEQPGAAPLTVPIWYDFEPDRGVWVITGPDSQKGRCLSEAGRFALCAQTEAPPYSYVSVEGPIIETREADREKDLRPMARRYMGEQGGDAYVASVPGGGGVVVTMRPERWRTVDYAKLSG